jgi:hypothetical protein
VLVVCKVATLPREGAQLLAEKMRDHVCKVKEDAGLKGVLRAEEVNRKEIFNAISSPYIELILQINTSFASEHSPHDPHKMDHTPAHREFVGAWRRAKQLEIEVIANGDLALA